MDRRSSTRLAIEESKKTFTGGGGLTTDTTTVSALRTSDVSKGKKLFTTQKSLTAPKIGGGISKKNSASDAFTLRYFFSKTTGKFIKAAPNAKKAADDVEIKLQVRAGRRPRSEWPDVVTMEELKRIYEERTRTKIRNKDWGFWGRKLRAEVQEKKEAEGDELE